MNNKVRKTLLKILKLIMELLAGTSRAIEPPDDDILGILIKRDVKVSNKKFSGTIKEDYLQAICDNCFISNVKITDMSSSKSAHRDAIQVIPMNNTNFTAGKVRQINMRNITIKAGGLLQGIFMSDGYIANAVFNNIKIKTKSQHTITLSGLQKGSFRRCKLSSPVILTPLRLFGATIEGRSVWIQEDISIRYDAIESDNSVRIIDQRRDDKRGWNVRGINARKILKEYDDKSKSFEERREIFIKKAIELGATVTEVD